MNLTINRLRDRLGPIRHSDSSLCLMATLDCWIGWNRLFEHWWRREDRSRLDSQPDFAPLEGKTTIPSPTTTFASEPTEHFCGQLSTDRTHPKTTTTIHTHRDYNQFSKLDGRIHSWYVLIDLFKLSFTCFYITFYPWACTHTNTNSPSFSPPFLIQETVTKSRTGSVPTRVRLEAGQSDDNLIAFKG